MSERNHTVCIWAGVVLLSIALVCAGVSVADRLRMATMADDISIASSEKREAWRQMREMETKLRAVRDVCQDAISRGMPFDGRAP